MGANCKGGGMLGCIRVCCLIVLAGAAASAEDRVIAALAAGECTLRVEASETWATLRVRAVHPQMGQCPVEQPAVQQVLEHAFAAVRSAANGRAVASLAFGRLIDYPWMARQLALAAAQDPGWDAGAGRPKGVDVNRYVAVILARPEIVSWLDAPLRRNGYRVSGVTVEKVLVGGSENVPGWEGPRPRGKVPFDAQVWFRLDVTP